MAELVELEKNRSKVQGSMFKARATDKHFAELNILEPLAVSALTLNLER